MVPNVSQLLTKTKTFKLKQSLTCADFGIYVATCVICHEQYVGRTSNKFSKRWSAHRSNWNKQYCKTDSDKDQMALSRHYSENHGTINKPPLHEAYTFTFVEQPSCHSLDILKALVFLYAFEESVDCHLLSPFCDDSNLHISLFEYVLSTMGVSKESISKFLIGNRFHVKLRILSPENCKQSFQVKS